MIANNSGNKLRASKALREPEDIRLLAGEEKIKVVERGEGDKDRVDTPTKSSFSNSVIYSRDRSVKPRTRIRDDYRVSRGSSERRGGGSTRGRGTHRKFDKDGETFLPRGKFQESLRGKSSDGVLNISSNKYGDIEGKSKSGMFSFRVTCSNNLVNYF